MRSKQPKYFALTWEEPTATSGVAYAPDDAPLAYELAEQIGDRTCVPLDLELRAGEAQDFLGNSLAWPLMSSAMKAIVEGQLTGEEGIDWVTVSVRVQGGVTTYFIPRFRRQLDVLDLTRTKFVDGTDHVIRPCFSLPKIQRFGMFHLPSSFWRITRGLYVAEYVKRALTNGAVSGVAFERTSTAG